MSHPLSNCPSDTWELDPHRYADLAQAMRCYGSLENSPSLAWCCSSKGMARQMGPGQQTEMFLPAAVHLMQKLCQTSLTLGWFSPTAAVLAPSLTKYPTWACSISHSPTIRSTFVCFPPIPEKKHFTSCSPSFLIWNASWNPVEPIS